MKRLLPTTLLGQQGINLLEAAVLQMGFVWYASQGNLDAGIDGAIVIREDTTGGMTAWLIQVQGKATDKDFYRETSETFEYLPTDDDLALWYYSNTPVILVLTRPRTREIYWISIRDYFPSAESLQNRRIRIDKSRDTLDESSRAALLAVVFADHPLLLDGDLPLREPYSTLFVEALRAREIAPDYISSHGSGPLDLAPPASDRILFYPADYEFLVSSGFTEEALSSETVRRRLLLELRTLILAMPPEASVVIPPTYYLETPICRELIQQHAALVDVGYIQLSLDFGDLSDYLVSKRERYRKAKHFPHYQRAYFEDTDHGLGDLNFRFTSKTRSVGRAALQRWLIEMTKRSSDADVSQEKVNELQKRVQDTERPSFLYENLEEHMETVGITEQERSVLRIRETKNKAYLLAYSRQGFAIPKGSEVVNDRLVPRTAEQPYDLRRWISLFRLMGAVEAIEGCPAERLPLLKRRNEVAVAIAVIREMISSGEASDSIMVSLKRRRLWHSFREALVAS